VVWNRNRGRAKRLTTSLALAQLGCSSRRSTHGRTSISSPVWKKHRAAMHSVGGPMLEKRSPGTPTIEAG
jgi:hypothetical protein